MNGSVLLVSMVIFTSTFYIHLNMGKTHDYMVSFIGKEHSRLFEHSYGSKPADLWVFGHVERKSKRMRFATNPFETFRAYGYSYMLLLNSLRDVPIIKSENVIVYLEKNNTIGIHWPVIENMPKACDEVDDWLVQYKPHITTIHL